MVFGAITTNGFLCPCLPYHKVFVAVTVHFEKDGVPVSMLLDIIEVAKSHSGMNLMVAFAKGYAGQKSPTQG
jgi:hypothetical protein